MQLWTIQTEAALGKLECDGRLSSDRSLADADFLTAYDWISDQMRQRIGPSPAGVTSPLWAWYQCNSESKRRPDLRRRGHLPRGETGFLIEFWGDDESVVLSDFDLWHFVLNYWYLPATVADGDRFDSTLDRRYSWNDPAPHVIDQEIRDSWQRIFDLEWYDPELTCSPGERQIQATLWELTAESIVTIQKFVAR